MNTQQVALNIGMFCNRATKNNTRENATCAIREQEINQFTQSALEKFQAHINTIFSHQDYHMQLQKLTIK